MNGKNEQPSSILDGFRKRMNKLTGLRRIALDTNIFIYHFHQSILFTSFTDKIFYLLSKNKLKAVTSIITVIELLSLKAPPAKVKELKETLEKVPNLQVLLLDENIAYEAARIRRIYRFRLPDSIQLATAKLGKAQAFISNDKKLEIFKEVKIILLEKV